MPELNRKLDRLAAVGQSLRSQLDKLKVERERLRREQEDLLALPRAHPEILADIDQALAAACEQMDEQAERVIQQLASTAPCRPKELSAALAGLLGKRISLHGFSEFIADLPKLLLLLAPEIRDLLASKLEGTEPGIDSGERATRLESVRAKLEGNAARMRDIQATAQRAGLNLSRRRAA